MTVLGLLLFGMFQPLVMKLLLTIIIDSYGGIEAIINGENI